ncbi:MAG: leucine-rich repeat protein, partial [Clostridia bacterium]|nr:leucine-rich repeat protein [Clostridia bacterium]
YAMWGLAQYTITFRYGEVNDNAVYRTITGEFGVAVTPPDDPEFDGYAFIGWDTQIPATMPSEDITITAMWTNDTGTYGKLTYRIYNKEVTITDCSDSASGSITIPDKIAGFPVTCIADHAFTCFKVTGVTIPDSVTGIEEYAFSNCRALSRIVIPKSVTSIGSFAFSTAPLLTASMFR